MRCIFPGVCNKLFPYLWGIRLQPYRTTMLQKHQCVGTHFPSIRKLQLLVFRYCTWPLCNLDNIWNKLCSSLSHILYTATKLFTCLCFPDFRLQVIR